MKTNKIIAAIFSLAVFCSCQKEEVIQVDAIPYKRAATYDVNSSDPNLKYVSNYFKDYKKVLLWDADSTDFKYAFESINDFRVVNATTADQVTKGIKMLDQLLIKFYTPEFIRSHFPFALIIASDVLTYKYPGYITSPNDVFQGRYLLACRIKDIDAMTATDKTNLSYTLHEYLWKYIANYNQFMQLPDEFYKYGLPYYGFSDYGVKWTQAQLYTAGFVFARSTSSSTYLPSVGEDIALWMNFLIRTPDATIASVCSQYEAMRVKYNHLNNALLKAGVDYKKLRYIP